MQYDDDAQKNYESFAQFSADADTIERWDAWIGLAGCARPADDDHAAQARVARGLRPHAEQLRLAWRFRGLDVRGLADVTRLMTMSVADLLDRFFESDQVKTVMALNGLIGTWAGLHEPGTGYVMAHHSIETSATATSAPGRCRGRHGRGERRDRVERSFPRGRDPHRARA